MGEFQVTTAQLKSKAEELKNYNASLKTKIEELLTVEGRLNGMWEGDAREAFHGEFGKDINKMQMFCQEIEKYVSSLLQIVQAYENAEAKNLNTATSRTY